MVRPASQLMRLRGTTHAAGAGHRHSGLRAPAKSLSLCCFGDMTAVNNATHLQLFATYDKSLRATATWLPVIFYAVSCSASTGDPQAI
jgi:hypothetical protein